MSTVTDELKGTVILYSSPVGVLERLDKKRKNGEVMLFAQCFNVRYHSRHQGLFGIGWKENAFAAGVWSWSLPGPHIFSGAGREPRIFPGAGAALNLWFRLRLRRSLHYGLGKGGSPLFIPSETISQHSVNCVFLLEDKFQNAALPIARCLIYRGTYVAPT